MTHQICSNNRLFFANEAESWASLCATMQERLDETQKYVGQRIVFVVDNAQSALGSVAYGIRSTLDFGVIERNRLSSEVETRFRENGVRLVDTISGDLIGPSPREVVVQPGRVTVLTSGTTGLLKLIPHTAETLNTFDRVKNLSTNCWFLPYQIGSYAWYQMVALSLFVPGQDLELGDTTDLVSDFETALKQKRVTAISSTPTFWRCAFMVIDQDLLKSAPLRQISLGGEVVDQAILDRLGEFYPGSIIRHIYASSEAGAAIVVADGRAGFSADILSRENMTVAVKIENGRLFVRSRYGNMAATGKWIDTGDLVEERQGRVFFCGRAGNAMINVGGQKAFPADIETHLMSHPLVAWARVTARRAPLVGHLPVAVVVLKMPMDQENAEIMLTAHCEDKIAEYAVPRMWDFLESVPMSASLKS